MDRNPFRRQDPTWHRDAFFNRDADTRKLLGKLRKGQSVSIFGRSGIGKTWLLYHIRDPDVAVQQGLVANKHLTCYADCRKAGDPDKGGCLELIKLAVEHMISPWRGCPIPTIKDITCSEVYGWLDRVLLQFRRADLQLIVQLDHFDQLADSNRLNLRLLGNLRALNQRYKGTMAYLTASTKSLIDLQGEFPQIMGSPFFDIFWDYELRPFSYDDALDFVISCLGLEEVNCPESVLKFLANLGHGEPSRLQLACACAYDVWQHKGRICLSNEDLGEIEKLFRRDLRSLGGAVT
jgi:hypothetical protein